MTTESAEIKSAASALLSARAVRERCNQVLAAGSALSHFRVHMERLDAVAAYVVETIRLRYPALEIPFHARWRHFTFAGVDRWGEILRRLEVDTDELARIKFDLVVTSVILDAGAGAEWGYVDQHTGARYARSEGLALASLECFVSGLFSSSGDNQLAADAAALRSMSQDRLATAFQVAPGNRLAGLAGRTDLLKSLGATIESKPHYFSPARPRIGHLFDWIKRSYPQSIEAGALLVIVLDAFGDIWPGRLEVDGVNLGDCWRHRAVRAGDQTDGLVPFHKLSQWLTYSLIEPLEEAGIAVTDIDALTGLAEYRNGGLFIDLGVLEIVDPAAIEIEHEPASEIIVEWRALTVALLDRLAILVRRKLGRSRETLPLASILEGGTWAAGRRIAAEMRADGGPPLRIRTDGSVF